MRHRRNPKAYEEVAEAWFDILDDQTARVWNEWMAARKRPPSRRGTQKWTVVPKDKLVRV